MTQVDAPARESISRTYDLIRSYIRRTPCLETRAEDFGLTSAPLHFKLELLQHSGSFKARGAFTNLLTRDVPASGVVAASGGNHGVAVAYAAQKLGVPARIFIPAITSPLKVARLHAYGAQVSIAGERYADALEVSKIWAAETGALSIHAYDQSETLLGQGTLGLEWESQEPDLDTLLIAVGGGGLIGGVAGWYRGRVRIVGVEPLAAPTLFRALEAGYPIDAEAGGVAADSLAPRRVGDLMFPLAQQFIERVVLVADDAIIEAQSALWNMLRIAPEPGGAAAFSALLSGAYRPSQGERIGVLVCGGNPATMDFAR